MVQATASVLYVNSARGRVQGTGTRQAPFKTLTQALGQATAGTTVQLEAGIYGSGESFPLTVPSGVTVVGLGGTVTIRGGGLLATTDVGQQSVTLQLKDRAQLRNVTITNPQSQGIGIWLDQGAALLTQCRFTSCGRDGVFVTGDALPVLLDNEFSGNQASGLFMARRSKGEVRQNRFVRTSYGIAISDQAAPLIIDNDVIENRAGIVLSRATRPVLRQNRVRRNQTSGLWVQETAQPDLGQSQDLGSNQFQENGQWDVRNDSRHSIVSAGNQINPNRVTGSIRYVASELPDPVAVPALLLGRVKPEPAPAQPKTPTPPPLNLNSRFGDVVGHWAAPFIDAMAEADLIKGFFDGSFRPDVLVTRAQFAALVMATFPATGGNSRRFKPFRDVPSGFWARPVIYQAQAQGFIAGFPDGTFRPNDPMTRGQALVALINGLRLGEGQASELGVYDDRAQVPPYAVEEVAIATRRGIVVNYPDIAQLRPMQPITRSETTALVYQCLVNLGRMQPLVSPFIVRPSSSTRSSGTVSAAKATVVHAWTDDFWQPLMAQNLLAASRVQQPDVPMTRAQFASLVIAAFDPESQRYPVAFRDVPSSHWAANAIHRAYRAKFLSGFPDYTFAPEQPILKIQVLLALVSGLQLRVKGTAGVLTRYQDQDQVPRYAMGAIATATKLGLVFNYPTLDTLAPNQVATCGEVAAMVYQGLVLRKRMPPVVSPYRVVISES
ncbi:S-layer homology domain-containing protein [Leptolyngbya cf. ectocarpi LEGE 11479]|uniref:S-layer homology domain-containing protein n=1 Tax=Leptolyngbya cf. ectocarpi LEGE 11479 TaxID=1828722 RepID=A0A928ZYU0_LEPEC|nr:S-layer homology domain-containing protein [Leptolyngbya ectocarpi]MBE9069941.1 S-layer homology domain-containing protein [Leptolyngbya cf. ectocarpi LEGE 11479]